MSVTIVFNGGARVVAKWQPNVNHVTIPRCPFCGAEPGRVRGDGNVDHDHGYGAHYDTYRVRAIAQCCTDETRIVDLGEMHVKVDTMFGIDEDEAVLVHGRARVYGSDSTRGGRP
jgi:hypothetical protein